MVAVMPLDVTLIYRVALTVAAAEKSPKNRSGAVTLTLASGKATSLSESRAACAAAHATSNWAVASAIPAVEKCATASVTAPPATLAGTACRLRPAALAMNPASPGSGCWNGVGRHRERQGGAESYPGLQGAECGPAGCFQYMAQEIRNQRTRRPCARLTRDSAMFR